jgi:hypothetical protein
MAETKSAEWTDKRADWMCEYVLKTTKSKDDKVSLVLFVVL